MVVVPEGESWLLPTKRPEANLLRAFTLKDLSVIPPSILGSTDAFTVPGHGFGHFLAFEFLAELFGSGFIVSFNHEG
jgi:hypothetical protein